VIVFLKEETLSEGRQDAKPGRMSPPEDSSNFGLPTVDAQGGASIPGFFPIIHQKKHTTSTLLSFNVDEKKDAPKENVLAK